VLNAFQKEIARVDEEIKKLQQETDGERRLLRALLEKLKQLGHDEVLELPDARAMYPKLF
jgi:septal ring factor EnvC (AmiA/AmiB activator)